MEVLSMWKPLQRTFTFTNLKKENKKLTNGLDNSKLFRILV